MMLAHLYYHKIVNRNDVVKVDSGNIKKFYIYTKTR